MIEVHTNIFDIWPVMVLYAICALGLYLVMKRSK